MPVRAAPALPSDPLFRKPDCLILLIAESPADIERLLIVFTSLGKLTLLSQHQRHVAKLCALTLRIADCAHYLQSFLIMSQR